MSQSDKLKNCYFVKNILMIMVVFYHSLAIWNGRGVWFREPEIPSRVLGIIALWLNSFHVYGFTLVSGYLYYYMRYEKKSSHYMHYSDFIKIKAKRLLVPYFFATIIWVMPVYVHFYRPTIKVLIERFILMESPSQLWFLIMLFGCSAVFYVFSDYIKDHTILGGIIVVLFYGIGIVGLRVLDNYFQVWTSCKYLVFFYIGFKLRQYDLKKIESVPSVLLFFIDIVLFGLWYKISKCEITQVELLSSGLLFFLNIFGSISSFIILQRFADNIKESKIGDILTMHNMTIYLFHQQFIYFVIEWCNGRINNYILAAMNFVFSFGAALLLSVILSKNKYTRFLISGKVF